MERKVLFSTIEFTENVEREYFFQLNRGTFHQKGNQLEIDHIF